MIKDNLNLKLVHKNFEIIVKFFFFLNYFSCMLNLTSSHIIISMIKKLN